MSSQSSFSSAQFDSHQRRFIGGHNAKARQHHSSNLQQHQLPTTLFHHPSSSPKLYSNDGNLPDSSLHHRKVTEFIPQKPTEDQKKDRRNKDRLSHLQKLLPAEKQEGWIGYLDVGCGNAEISSAVAQSLGIQKAMGIDVFEESDFVPPEFDEETNPNFEFVYKQNKNNKIQLDSNAVDLITCFMVIHHFDQLDAMMKEIKRVLILNGFLFIREHDVPAKDDTLRTYIEEMHRKFPDQPVDGYMNLFDRESLKDIISSYGFLHLGDSDYVGSNPQAVYHSLYVLKQKEQEILSDVSQCEKQNGGNKSEKQEQEQVKVLDEVDEAEEQSSEKKRQKSIAMKNKIREDIRAFNSGWEDVEICSVAPDSTETTVPKKIKTQKRAFLIPTEPILLVPLENQEEIADNQQKIKQPVIDDDGFVVVIKKPKPTSKPEDEPVIALANDKSTSKSSSTSTTTTSTTSTKTQPPSNATKSKKKK